MPTKQQCWVLSLRLRMISIHLLTFTITAISRMIPAELNEEFFEKIFPGEEIKTEEAMLERIKKEASQSFSTESDRKFFNDALEAIINGKHHIA
jgi:trigger factor